MQTDSPYECAACGHGFTGIEAFDQHQSMLDDEAGTVVCHDPEKVGLVWQDKAPSGAGYVPAGWRLP
jgi:hypothetical protein